MKSFSHLVLGVLLLHASCSVAGGPLPDAAITTSPSTGKGEFFTGTEGGFFWLQNESLNIGSIRADANFSTGWGATVPLGYDFGNGFSASFSAGYYHANIDALALNGLSTRQNLGVGGDVDLVPLMLNGDYKVPIMGNLSAYLGGGLGTVYNEVNVDPNGKGGFGVADHSLDFGLEAFTGLSYDIGAFSSLRLGYRYIHVFGNDADHNGHGLEIGVMIRF